MSATKPAAFAISKSLEKQISEAKRQLEPLARVVQQAQENLTAWGTAWADALSTAGLPEDSSTAQVKDILEVAKDIEQALVEIANIRSKRIATMQADLEQHEQAAQVLAAALAPELANATAEAIAPELSARLESANAAYQEATRLRGVIHDAESKLATAQESQSQTQASIQPLLTRAKITEHADLQHAIERSDQWRELSRAKAGAEQALQEQGDGLTVEQLHAEAAAEDLQALATEIAELGVKDQDMVVQLGELSANLQSANTALNAIGGTADAARAEAQRQEARSKMTDAVERYLKVYTGARLLRLSIDRYREAKQGPMLHAASRIFAGLTLGSFERLGVDYDSAEPKLIAKRADGSAPLDIEGMSEGTRDQLYLALRLAADEHAEWQSRSFLSIFAMFKAFPSGCSQPRSSLLAVCLLEMYRLGRATRAQTLTSSERSKRRCLGHGFAFCKSPLVLLCGPVTPLVPHLVNEKPLDRSATNGYVFS